MLKVERRIAATECLALYAALSEQDKFCVPEDFVRELKQYAIADSHVRVRSGDMDAWRNFTPHGQEQAQQMLALIARGREDQADVIAAAECLGVIRLLAPRTRAGVPADFVRSLEQTVSGRLTVNFIDFLPLDMQEISDRGWQLIKRMYTLLPDEEE